LPFGIFDHNHAHNEKMPSQKYHIKRSKSDFSTAKAIHSLMDLPPSMDFSIDLHHEWRKKTHNLPGAISIGMMIGMESRKPRMAIRDAMRHVLDDMQLTVYNNMMRVNNGEEEEG